MWGHWEDMGGRRRNLHKTGESKPATAPPHFHRTDRQYAFVQCLGNTSSFASERDARDDDLARTRPGPCHLDGLFRTSHRPRTVTLHS